MSEAATPQHADDATSVTPQAMDQLIQAPPEVVPTQSAGQVIRQAREAAGVSVAHLAAGLKVPSKTILALEDNNMAALPDLAFSRALASSICRTLKIESAPILALMPSLPQAHVVTNQEVGLNLPMASPFKLNFSLNWLRSSTFAIIAGLALATLAVANWPLVMGWLDQAQKSSKPAASAASVEAQPVGMPTMVESTSVSPVMAPASVAAPVVQPAATLVVPSPAASTPTTPLTAASAPVPASGPSNQLVFKATGSTWVEVTDAAGKPVWKKLLATNEVASVAAPMVARVLVGNVAGTSLTVNGANFNFAPFAANNIARFEVK